MFVCVYVAVLSCGEAGAGAGSGPRLGKRYVGLYTGPYFDPSAPNNITTQLGTHAYLPCKVYIRAYYLLHTIAATRSCRYQNSHSQETAIMTPFNKSDLRFR